MSKSLGNVVNPMDMIDRAGVDAFRYFLLAEMSPGNDANFSERSFLLRYNSDLANDLGNLLSRVAKLIVRATGGPIPVPGAPEVADQEICDLARGAVSAMRSSLEELKLDQGINAAMNVVRAVNRYIEHSAPWTLAKEGKTERLHTVLYTAADALRIVASLLAPVMPEKMAELGSVLGFGPGELPAISDLEKPSTLPGRTVKDSVPLFPRILIEESGAETCAKPAKAEKAAAKEQEVPVAELIAIEDFGKVQLRTAKVLEAAPVEGADKLLKLKIEVGSETRQLVAGVAKYYTPEAIVGKTIVIVANLKPATIRGVESQGMLLAAKSGKECRLVTVDGDLPSGILIG